MHSPKAMGTVTYSHLSLSLSLIQCPGSTRDCLYQEMFIFVGPQLSSWLSLMELTSLVSVSVAAVLFCNGIGLLAPSIWSAWVLVSSGPYSHRFFQLDRACQGKNLCWYSSGGYQVTQAKIPCQNIYTCQKIFKQPTEIKAAKDIRILTKLSEQPRCGRKLENRTLQKLRIKNKYAYRKIF